MADQLVLAAFSVLYTVNIAVSNISMGMVSLPFHQIVRAMGPAVTVLLELAILRKHRSNRVYLSLVPVCLGVALTSAGELDFTWLGAAMTALGVVLACWKQIATNQLLVGSLKLHPLDLLWRMSLFSAIQCAVISSLNGEVVGAHGYMDKIEAGSQSQTFLFHMSTNAVLAFLINYVSFGAAPIIGPLGISVAANVKQVMVIILAIFMFGFKMTLFNAIGVPVTLLGGIWYSRESAAERQQAAPTTKAEVESVESEKAEELSRDDERHELIEQSTSESEESLKEEPEEAESTVQRRRTRAPKKTKAPEEEPDTMETKGRKSKAAKSETKTARRAGATEAVTAVEKTRTKSSSKSAKVVATKEAAEPVPTRALRSRVK